MHFLPMNYLINTVITATNNKGKKENARWTDMDLDKMLHLLGLLLAMQVYKIHGPRRLYWSNNDNDLLPGMNFGKIKFLKKFCTVYNFQMLRMRISKFLILLLQSTSISKNLLCQDHFWLMARVHFFYKHKCL